MGQRPPRGMGPRPRPPMVRGHLGPRGRGMMPMRPQRPGIMGPPPQPHNVSNITLVQVEHSYFPIANIYICVNAI